MILETNFAEVPDKIPVVEAGIHNCSVKEVGFREASKTANDKERKAAHTFQLLIEEGPEKGKILFDEFPSEFLQDVNSPSSVKFRHFLKSAGITPGPRTDTADLKGKFVKVMVGHRVYKDSTGSDQTQAVVKDYLYSA